VISARGDARASNRKTFRGDGHFPRGMVPPGFPPIMSTTATSKKPKASVSQAVALVVTVASLAAKSVEELTTFARAQFEAGRAAFINAAKAMIELDVRGEDGLKVLRKAGVKLSTVQNARYAVRFYHDAVKPGFVTEADFDQMGYLDFYRACIVADRLGGKDGWKSLGERKLLTEPEELQCLYEHRMTRAEKILADKKAADEAKKAAATPAAPAQAPKAAAAPAKSTPAPTPAQAEALAAKVTAGTTTAPAAVPAPAPVAETTPIAEVETPAPASTPAPAAEAPAPAAPPPPAPVASGPVIGDLTKLLDSAAKLAETLMQNDPSLCELVVAQATAFGKRTADAAQEITDKATAPAAKAS
jgi:hypothetical protein